MKILQKTIRFMLAALMLTMMVVGQATAGVLSTTYYHNDALGSPVVATDEDGNVKWREQYRPYGEKMVYDAESLENTRWYTGHPHDEETGLTYAGARYYDPVVGRFMGVDPVGPASHFESGNKLHGFNLYTYGNNNPYRYVDPDGAESQDAAWAALGETNPNAALQARASQIGSTANTVADVGDSIASDQLSWIPGGLGVKTFVASVLGVKAARMAKKGEVFYKTTKEATVAAKALGYAKTKLKVKGEVIYYNRSQKLYLSRDVGSGDGNGSHNGGVWKLAKTAQGLGSKKTRLGTYDADLKRIGD